MRYDYLIVGAGLFGAVFARQAMDKNRRCLVVDRRGHIGGNLYTELVEGIPVHRYGPHIFHTSRRDIWGYVNRFAEFGRFVNAPLARCGGQIYHLPFNMNTFYELWGVAAPEEARRKLAEQRAAAGQGTPRNLEEQALQMVGKDLYELLVKGYTEKQWGRPCTELPPFLIRRLPLRYTYNNDYFDDCYEGVPREGYTPMLERMLKGAELLFHTDFLEQREALSAMADKIVYTGRLDELYGFRYGELAHRSLHFETRVLQQDNFQGNAVVNFPLKEVPYTRVVEHKHFVAGSWPHTVVTWEYPRPCGKGDIPFYPVNDGENGARYARYRALAEQEPNLLFGGRLAEFRYLNMDAVVASALDCAKQELG